jgi:hypothetical protein
MRRKPGIAGLIKEKEQQSALSAVGEQIEVGPLLGHGTVLMLEDSGYRSSRTIKYHEIKRVTIYIYVCVLKVCTIVISCCIYNIDDM